VDDDAKGHIRRFSAKATATAANDANGACLTCHNRGTHAGWEGSMHEARGLTCTTCHSVHNPQSLQHQLVKTTETQVCVGCHRPQVVKTERAVAHMPVREGKMACSSCHNPHGSINNVKALRVGSSVNETCSSCHAEMRGPMLFEHAPVRENCATCHDPHGSSNDRMLNVRMPMLCQRCHVATRHPASVYDNAAITTNKSNRMFGRSCVNCHSNIHGSNHPSGQFFMR
jgi:DmsE family decaheme c-type cytochrome